MSNHQVDQDHQMGELAHLRLKITTATNEAETQAPLMATDLLDDPRPIELVYSNEHPYAHTEVRIFGQVLNPANYRIDGKRGIITLEYHWHRVKVSIDK